MSFVVTGRRRRARGLGRVGGGFTLVELLVVIGIIALLLAILLPVLSRARESGNRVKCLATLRTMVQAAHLHAGEHQGYMPIAGSMEPLPDGTLNATPETLGDPGRRRYIYWEDGDILGARSLPLTIALAQYMGALGNAPPPDSISVLRMLQSSDLQQLFTCPSQGVPGRASFTVRDGNRVMPMECSSYVFNAFVLSLSKPRWVPATDSGPWCPAGKLTQVRLPSEVFLFADGVPEERYHSGYGIQWARSSEDTLYEYWWDTAGLPTNQFDFIRHRSMINVAYVDGHGETLALPNKERIHAPGNHGDLDRILLTRGVSFR